MATYTFPTSSVFLPQRVTLRQMHSNQVFQSPLSGYTQTSSLPGARWGWSIDWGPGRITERPQLEGLLTRLSGREHRLALWDLKRPTPRGTILTSGVTASAAAQFSTTMTMNNCGAGRTLLAGDWFSVGGQLLMCVVDATANGSGVMTVEFRHMLRAALAPSSPVTLVQPTALYVLESPQLEFQRQPGNAEPSLGADFMEVFA